MSTLAAQTTTNTFDVFVSYCEPDASWVLEELCPRLQASKVRVAHRGGFSPGLPIVDEIERAIRDCSWTLLVFTPSYLGDTWARYEETLAVSAVLETGAWRVIPVVKGQCELPDRIQRLVRVDLSDNQWREWDRLVDRILGPKVPPPPPQIGIRDAIAALKAKPDVRDMMVRFGADFRAASEQIDVLANYKYLHDQLHNVQLSCYRLILAQVRQFPDDELGRETLGQYALTLLDYIETIREVTGRPTFATEDVSWVDDLALAYDDLQGSLATLDPRQLRRAVSRLRRVLDLQPAQINSRMNQTAGALRLPDLVTSLRIICQRLSGVNIVPAELEGFTAQLNTVSSMSDELVTLRSHHDRWQDLDCALRRIEDVLRLDIEELQNSWEYLKRIAEPLCSNTSEMWAQRFRESMHQLECAINRGVEKDVKQPFLAYRTHATHQFFRVDESMKDLCVRLQKVGQPIEITLGIST